MLSLKQLVARLRRHGDALRGVHDAAVVRDRAEAVERPDVSEVAPVRAPPADTDRASPGV